MGLECLWFTLIPALGADVCMFKVHSYWFVEFCSHGNTIFFFFCGSRATLNPSTSGQWAVSWLKCCPTGQSSQESITWTNWIIFWVNFHVPFSNGQCNYDELTVMINYNIKEFLTEAVQILCWKNLCTSRSLPTVFYSFPAPKDEREVGYSDNFEIKIALQEWSCILAWKWALFSHSGVQSDQVKELAI